MASIFVQLATYHDYELSKTILDAIAQSSGEHIINFGVSLAYYVSNDITLVDRPDVKYTISEAPKNVGLGAGRMLAHKFYDGEDYYFQVDSHSRFDKDWDSYLIGEVSRFRDMGIAKPLLTCYPKGYRYRDGIEDFDTPGPVTQIVFTENRAQFAEILIPTQRADANTDNNIFSKSVSGGSIFTVGAFIKPSPKIAFYGEEIFIAARAFTNGFDLMIPSKTFMSHLYYDHKRGEMNFRHLVWQDFPDKFAMMNDISLAEIKRTFTDNVVGEYNLGTERTLRDYEVYSGLNFSTGEITECAS